MRSSSTTGHTAKRTKLTDDPANRARSLGVAPYAALLVACSPRSQRAGCVASLRWPLFERMGVSDPSTLAQMAKVELELLSMYFSIFPVRRHRAGRIEGGEDAMARAILET